jgi:hypothetical protein
MASVNVEINARFLGMCSWQMMRPLSYACYESLNCFRFSKETPKLKYAAVYVPIIVILSSSEMSDGRLG